MLDSVNTNRSPNPNYNRINNIKSESQRRPIGLPVSAGLRTGQTGQLPRGLHKKGPPQKHIFFKYMAVSYSVCHRGLLVNVCKFHFNYAFYTEVNG